MQVRKICGLGYFDRLIVDGYMMPMYNNKGIEVRDNESLVESLDTNKQSYNQGIGKLKINIAGESLNTESYQEIEKMREHRENELKLQRTKIGLADRYIIGHMDILILKSDYAFPKNVTNKGKTKEDIIKLAKGENELNLLLKALDLQYTAEFNIAIVDKVYINKEFRRCGISSWLHTNIADIVKIYGMVDISSVLLETGDFSEEAKDYFNMTKKEYELMLTKHYKNVGYKRLQNNIMCKKLNNNK